MTQILHDDGTVGVERLFVDQGSQIQPSSPMEISNGDAHELPLASLD
jgi:hypothetical protein